VRGTRNGIEQVHVIGQHPAGEKPASMARLCPPGLRKARRGGLFGVRSLTGER
jgi:hypothetical protein